MLSAAICSLQLDLAWTNHYPLIFVPIAIPSSFSFLSNECRFGFWTQVLPPVFPQQLPVAITILVELQVEDHGEKESEV